MLEIEIDSVSDVIEENYSHCEIKSFNNSELKYTDFFEKYMLRNLPCIIKNVTNTWQCTLNWIKDDTVNYDYFIKKYGEMEAPVADCDAINFNAHCKSNMKLMDYMAYLRSTKKEKLLYLKDWHLRRLRPDDLFYEVPLLFASDWLNEYATDLQEDDFMFVYIGPQNSWTPLHVDVYNSYSWSVNVVGRKKWILFPPGEEEKLKDSLGNLPLMFTCEKFPSVRYLEIIQEKGDGIFVPSGWHHQVVNLFDTISVNHNWVNGCNLGAVWSSLQKCLISVENEIQDLKDSPEFVLQCQLILKSLFGMNFSDFLTFVTHIGKKRMCQLKGEEEGEIYNFTMGINHIKFDLKILHKIINLIHNHPLFSNKCLSADVASNFVNIKNRITAAVIKSL